MGAGIKPAPTDDIVAVKTLCVSVPLWFPIFMSVENA